MNIDRRDQIIFGENYRKEAYEGGLRYFEELKRHEFLGGSTRNLYGSWKNMAMMTNCSCMVMCKALTGRILYVGRVVL